MCTLIAQRKRVSYYLAAATWTTTIGHVAKFGAAFLEVPVVSDVILGSPCFARKSAWAAGHCGNLNPKP